MDLDTESGESAAIDMSKLAPLEDPSSQIRLLRIMQGGDENDIECEITVHKLDDVRDSFIAVSYTWGDAGNAKTVRVNGNPVPVRYNCWYALWQMKLYDSTRPIWIDSLCIDQSAHAEKSMQVRQMGAIYSEAYEVAACVGAEGPDILVYRKASKDTDRDLGYYIRHPEGAREMIAAFSFLAHRQYFQRLWTVQECVLAKHVQMFLGRYHCPWREIMDLYDGVMSRHEYGIRRDCEEPLPELDGVTVSLREFHRDAREYVNFEEYRIPIRLPNLIDRYQNRLCYEPRDRIFALMSLCPRMLQERIAIDYAMPLHTLLLAHAAAYEIIVSDGRWWSDQTAQRAILQFRQLRKGFQQGNHSPAYTEAMTQILGETDPQKDWYGGGNPRMTGWDAFVRSTHILCNAFIGSREFWGGLASICSEVTVLPSVTLTVTIDAHEERSRLIGSSNLDTLEAAVCSIIESDPPGSCCIALSAESGAIINQKHIADGSLSRCLFGPSPSRSVIILTTQESLSQTCLRYAVPPSTTFGDLLLHTSLSSGGLERSQEPTFVLRRRPSSSTYRMVGLARFLGEDSLPVAETQDLTPLAADLVCESCPKSTSVPDSESVSPTRDASLDPAQDRDRSYSPPSISWTYSPPSFSRTFRDTACYEAPTQDEVLIHPTALALIALLRCAGLEFLDVPVLQQDDASSIRLSSETENSISSL